MHALPAHTAVSVAAPPAEGEPSRRLVQAALKLYVRLCIRALHVEVEAPWPAGPKIIAPNHANGSDGFALPLIFPGPLVALVQADLFQLPVVGQWLTRAGWVPVAPGQGPAVLAAARRHLNQGRSVVICPEGRLNHGGPLHPGKTGAVRLALATGAPIIPVGCYVPPPYARTLHGTSAGQATFGRWQIGGPLYVEVGAPLWVRHFAGAEGPNAARLVTDHLMQRIASLVAQATRRAAP